MACQGFCGSPPFGGCRLPTRGFKNPSGVFWQALPGVFNADGARPQENEGALEQRKRAMGIRRLPVVTLGAIAVAFGLSACGGKADGAPQASAVHFDRVTADPVEHGKRLVTVLGCVGCHSPDLAGRDMLLPQMGTFWSANLTIARHTMTDQQFRAAITDGMGPKRPLWMMPSFGYSQISDEDLSAIIAYIRSLPDKGEAHPEPVFGAAVKKMLTDGVVHTSDVDVKALGAIAPVDAGQDYALGRYIARAACAHCHRPDLRGGELPGSTEKPADLRIAAAYDDADFKTLLRTGVGAGGRKLGMMSEVAKGDLFSLTDHEIGAVHAYLKKLAELDP
jgi:mono/diheme cytochrome c family protein